MQSYFLAYNDNRALRSGAVGRGLLPTNGRLGIQRSVSDSVHSPRDLEFIRPADPYPVSLAIQTFLECSPIRHASRPCHDFCHETNRGACSSACALAVQRRRLDETEMNRDSAVYFVCALSAPSN